MKPGDTVEWGNPGMPFRGVIRSISQNGRYLFVCTLWPDGHRNKFQTIRADEAQVVRLDSIKEMKQNV